VSSNIRVYELARELGLTNKETLDLSDSLGIGVKSHSSSIVDAQADRVRRKAEREGLIRDEQPPEPKPAKKAAKKSTKKAAKKATKKSSKKSIKKSAAKASKPPTKEAAAVADAPVEDVPAEDVPVAEPEVSDPAPVTPEPEIAAEPAVAKPVAPATPKRVISSSGSSAPPKRPTEDVAPPAPAPVAKKVVKKVVKKLVKKVAIDPSKRPPTSGSGKPIPPPPRSTTGRAIPPPPGGRPRPAGGPAAPGGNRPSGPSRGGPLPSGGRRSGGPRDSVPGAGAPPGGGRGGPGGGRGGPGGGRPGGPGGRPPRRKGRRRRSREELQPMDTPSYTPLDAPVPAGEIVVERSSTALDLGPKTNRTAADVIRFLMQQGEMVTATQSLSDDMIELFAAEVGAEIRLVDPGEEQEVELQKLLDLTDDTSDDLPLRPPVITVMGHVDHGKTLLLDRIRNARVVEGEAGGITQHIGAYQVERDGHHLTFIDTPGHAAFTAMRARGAASTDIVILMVAADDGVMPQTIEAINHAKAAEVPIIVAINKIDRANADVQKAIAGVAEHGLVPEAWGGETIFQEISALQDLGIDELLDQILLVAEVEDLHAPEAGRAGGVVLEANLDIGRGPVATVLVQRGTLKVGDPLVAGAAWGRVRAMINDRGENVKEAGPSTPVQVLGLSDVAAAGDEFVVAPTEKVAGRVADTREHWQRQSSLGREAHALSGGAKLEDIFEQIQRGEAATLNLVIKTDMNGSLEAVTESLRKLERDEVKVGFVHRGVGGITENDIQLAAAANATLIGFNVRPDRKARDLAEYEGVEIRSYEIIYKLLEDIEDAMVGLLAPEFEEIVTGDAEVREIFKVPRIGAIAGCYVLNGVITRNSKVRFLREGSIIWKGKVNSLRRFKDDAKEVAAGYECGIGLSDFQDLRAGDIIETFEEREIARTLDS